MAWEAMGWEDTGVWVVGCINRALCMCVFLFDSAVQTYLHHHMRQRSIFINM